MCSLQANAMLGVSVVFPVLAGLFVMLRFKARKIMYIPLLADDWVIVMSLVRPFKCHHKDVHITVGAISGFLRCAWHNLHRWSCQGRSRYPSKRVKPKPESYVVEGWVFLLSH